MKAKEQSSESSDIQESSSADQKTSILHQSSIEQEQPSKPSLPEQISVDVKKSQGPAKDSVDRADSDSQPTMRRDSGQRELVTVDKADGQGDLNAQLAHQIELAKQHQPDQRAISTAHQERDGIKLLNDNMGEGNEKIFTQNQRSETEYPYKQLITEESKPKQVMAHKRTVMTAPFGHNRRARMFAAGYGQQQNKPKLIEDSHAYNILQRSIAEDTLNSSAQKRSQRAVINQCFVESDLLKATNIYSQFDRKGNLLENRLYAKTSINQAKLNKETALLEKIMAASPDEYCRINNGSQQPSEQDQMYNTVGTGKSQMATNQNQYFSGTQTSINGRSQASHSVSNFPANKTASNFRMSPTLTRKSKRNHKTYVTTHGTAKSYDADRCTFSRANGPRIDKADMTSNPNKPYFNPPTAPSLFAKMQNETNEVYKSVSVTSQAKNNQGASLMSAQKSFQKLRQLNDVVNTWSNMDQNMMATGTGVGGAKMTFRTAQNFMTNDPGFYKNRAISHTSRYANVNGVSMSANLVQEPVNQPYFYMTTKEGDVKGGQKINPNNFFATAQQVNVGAKTFYGQCLDGKSDSKVFGTRMDSVSPKRAGLPSQIQKRAYRANTQSRQVDGLYKPERFQKRVNMLNQSRVDFNIIRPNVPDPSKSMHLQKPQQVLENIRKGKCHQVYGISDFNQNARLGALKLHEKYQAQFTKDNNSFKRHNGEFTSIMDQLKNCRFS